MKSLDVAFKDLLQSTRSLSAIVFMFGVPILVTLLFFLIFGGFGDDEGFQLPETSVALANLDQGQLPPGFAASVDTGAGMGVSLAQAESMGDVLAQIVQGEALADFMAVTMVESEEEARSMVDNEEAQAALIVPAGFTDSLFLPGGSSQVKLYKDPTLTFGPAIVEAIVGQVLDGFAANKIGIGVAFDTLAESGTDISPERAAEIALAFTNRSAETAGATGEGSVIATRLLSGNGEAGNLVTEIVGVILGGMMVFFAFFTGSAGVQSILVEEENGTLARLFTTPTPVRSILAGKVLAAALLLVVQVTVLLIFGSIVFGIEWGDPLTVAMAGVGIVVTATTTGLFLVSWLKTTRQAGIIFGGVLTLAGMVGLIPVFTAGVPDQPAAVQTASLFVPQGWAVRGLMTAMDGGRPADIAFTLLVLLVISLVFAAVGQRRLQRRFA